MVPQIDTVHVVLQGDANSNSMLAFVFHQSFGYSLLTQSSVFSSLRTFLCCEAARWLSRRLIRG